MIQKEDELVFQSLFVEPQQGKFATRLKISIAYFAYSVYNTK